MLSVKIVMKHGERTGPHPLCWRVYGHSISRMRTASDTAHSPVKLAKNTRSLTVSSLKQKHEVARKSRNLDGQYLNAVLTNLLNIYFYFKKYSFRDLYRVETCIRY